MTLKAKEKKTCFWFDSSVKNVPITAYIGRERVKVFFIFFKSTKLNLNLASFRYWFDIFVSSFLLWKRCNGIVGSNGIYIPSSRIWTRTKIWRWYSISDGFWYASIYWSRSRSWVATAMCTAHQLGKLGRYSITRVSQKYSDYADTYDRIHDNGWPNCGKSNIPDLLSIWIFRAANRK